MKIFSGLTFLLGVWGALAACSYLPTTTSAAIAANAGSESFSEPQWLAGARARARAQDELPHLDEQSPFKDYLVYAALENPGLKSAFQRWKTAMEKVPQVTALPDPMLTFGVFIEEVETRVGPQEWKASLSQRFPWFGKRHLKGQVAAEEANAAWFRYQARKLDLFHRVADAYAEYYYLKQAIEVTRENLSIVKRLEKVARTQYRTGATSHAVVIKAQVEMGKLEERLASLEDLRGPRSAKLNAALGRTTDATVPWPKALPQRETEALSREKLMTWLKDANPEVKALRAEVDSGEAAVELAGKRYYPDVTAGLSYIDTGSAVMPGADDSGKDPVALTLGVNLPIWRDSYRAGERQAQAKLRDTRHSLRDRLNVLASDARLALYDVQDARRRIGLYKNTLVPKARQSLKANETAFRAGKMDFLSVLDSQRELLQFELSHQRALADHVEATARLEKLVGRELTMPTGESSEETSMTGE